MNPGSNKMESNLTTMWVNFFGAAGIPSDVGATYALTFTENRIQNDMLLELNKEYLRDMGITRMGDVIAILRHAKQVHESTARDRVLSVTASATTVRVPVAAVTGRTTGPQALSPASRILEHYTRNPTKETSPVAVPQLKRKQQETGMNASDVTVKKSRLIRFGSAPQPQATEVASSKQTVFARLGNGSTDTNVVKTTKTVTVATANNQDTKPIYARLGTKANEIVPIERDALKYEGILKSPPKMVMVTTTKNNVRRTCTMRADETPVSVKEKLAIPKAKTVKFSNTVHYKEIEANKIVIPKPVTPVFNKPERRLSMPMLEQDGVKSRLGVKNKNDLTITTKNVFNRLGV